MEQGLTLDHNKDCSIEVSLRILEKPGILASTFTVLAVLAVFQSFPPRVEAASTGIVCTAQPVDLYCRPTAPIFNGPLTTPETLLRVPIVVNNTDVINGFDITLKVSDVTKLKPFDADLTGTVMPTSVVLGKCIGGVLLQGSTCVSATDTPDTLHLSLLDTGNPLPAGTTGLLFTAVFSITGTTLVGGITIGYQTGCLNSSVSGTTTCVSMPNGTTQPTAESVQSGGFDNSNLAILPYVTMSPAKNSLGQFLQGLSSSTTDVLTLTSVNQFNTTTTPTVSLVSTVTGKSALPVASLSRPQVDFSNPPVTRTTSTLTVNVSRTTARGNDTVTVGGIFTTQDPKTFITSSLETVVALPMGVIDFAMTANPNSLSINVLTNNSAQAVITVSPVTFAGQVALGVQKATLPSGVTAAYSAAAITFPGTSTLTITASTSTPQGTYPISLTANSTLNGVTRTHFTALMLTIGSSEFQLTANPSSLILTTGSTGFSIVTVTALNGFAGIVTLSATTAPSSGLKCNLGPMTIALSFTASGTSTVSCAGSTGTYAVAITGSGGGQSHLITLEVTVQSNSQGAVISVDPYATIDLPRTSKTITITVNLTNAPAINGFAVILAYDYKVLHASSLNYSTNIFAQLPYALFITRNCLDGIPFGGSSNCQGEDGPGVTSFAMTILGPYEFNGTAGPLFRLTFDVANTTAPNFSQIQVMQAQVFNGTPTQLSTTAIDGYYTSLACNGIPCTPPKVDFKWSPVTPELNRLVTFRANASINGSSATITDYLWTWDDGFSIETDSGTTSTSTHIFSTFGNHEVTLKITESNGVKWSKTIPVVVATPINFDVSAPQEIVINSGQHLTIPNSVIVQSFNVSGTISLFASTPQGLTVSFNPTVLTLTQSSVAYSSLVIFALSAILPGTYVFTITAFSAAAGARSVIVTVMVPPGDFSLTIGSGGITMNPGSNATVFVSLFTTNINATVNLSLQFSNPAFSVLFSPSSLAIFPNRSFSSLMLIRANPGIQPGNYVLNVLATTSSITRVAFVFVTITSPPDFTIQTFPLTIQILDGSPGFLEANAQRSLCCPFPQPPLNVTLSVAIFPLAPNGPIVSLQDNFLIVYGSSYTTVRVLTRPNTQTGNYTLTVTGRTDSFVHSSTSTVMVLPPPVLKTTPSSGLVGTKVDVRGLGFVFFSPPGYYPQTHTFWVTFDDQFLGEAFTSNRSFVFTFNVPDAEPGPHLIKALDILTGVNATAPFQVLAEPAPLTVSIDTGTIYFPGDTATVYVLISQNGLAVQAPGVQLHLTLIKPDGSNVSLNAKGLPGGLLMAVYAVPTTGPIGTYALLATAQGPNSAHGTALHTFEVKPSWLSSKSQALVSATGAIGAVGLVAFAWKKGYLRRKQGDQEIFA